MVEICNMTQRIEYLAQRLEDLSEWTGRGIAWLTLLMVLITFLVVVLRYAFNTGWIAMQESVTYLHATVFMLGAAYTLKHNAHVRVDIFYHKFSPRQKALVDLAGSVLLLLPVCGFILWSSWGYVLDSWGILEGSPETSGLPLIYLLKTVLLLMPVLLILQNIAQILQCLQILYNRATR